MMQRNRILFICTNADIGGGEVQLIYLAKELKIRNYEVLVVLPGEGQVSRSLENEDVKYQTINSLLFVKKNWYIVFPLIGFIQLIKIIKSFKPDFVHLMHYQAIKIGGLVAGIFKVPTIWTCHGFWFSPKGLRGIYINALLDKIVTVSEYAKKGLIKNGRINEDKIEIINNSVPDCYFTLEEQGVKFKEEHKVPQNKVIIGIMARLEKIKRHDIFIEVLHKLVKQKYPVHGLLVGSELLGDPRDRVEQSILEQIKRLGLQDHITILPFQQNPIPAYDAVDVLLVPSDQEAFSNAVIEGMARSKPVISTACGGPQEIIKDSETGYLVPVNGSEIMANKVAWLIANSQQRVLIGKKAREYSHKKYHLNKMVDDYIAIYNRL